MFEEPQEKQSLFSLEMDYEEVIEIPDDFLQVRLNEMENKETFTGKPQISGIMTNEYDNGSFDEDGNPKTDIVHKLRMVLVNTDEEQYLDININLKKADYNVDVIRKGSVLFDFIQSILEIENKGATKGKNIFKNVNLKQFTDFINNNVETMTVKNIERRGKYSFNSFYIVKINNMELNI